MLCVQQYKFNSDSKTLHEKNESLEMVTHKKRCANCACINNLSDSQNAHCKMSVKWSIYDTGKLVWVEKNNPKMTWSKLREPMFSIGKIGCRTSGKLISSISRWNSYESCIFRLWKSAPFAAFIIVELKKKLTTTLICLLFQFISSQKSSPLFHLIAKRNLPLHLRNKWCDNSENIP